MIRKIIGDHIRRSLDYYARVGGIEFLIGKHERKDKSAAGTGEVVILIPGLWMPSLVMTVMARRLDHAGLPSRIFSYSSRHRTLKQNAAALAAFLQDIDASRMHFVAHSLGGLLVMQLLQDYPRQCPGRVVVMGTPYCGSYVAQRLSRHAVGHWFCGLSLEDALLGDGPRWPGERDLGVVAGTLPIGAGWITPGLAKPNDGTVAVAETVVKGCTDRITLPVTHTGLVFSSVVARQVIQFLATGCFIH